MSQEPVALDIQIEDLFNQEQIDDNDGLMGFFLTIRF